MTDMSSHEKKKYIKTLFRGYRNMNRDLEKKLGKIGIQVQHSKKHIKLLYNDKVFICPASASDVRSGSNFASILCREM